MVGLEEREHNGIHIARLHYIADPAKRSGEWKAQAREGFVSDREWRREMEIDWTVASGLPVYAEEFIRDFHIAKEPLLAYPDKTILRGWDFGLQPACAFTQVDTQGRLNVIGEYVTWDGRGDMKQKGILRFAEEVIALSNDWYPGAPFRDYADPAGWSKAQTDERTCVEIMRDKDIHPIQGPITFEARKRAMVAMLGEQAGGRAKLLISPDCHMLIEGFEGAYKYEQIGETGRYKETVEKNAWSHPMNALEYIIGAVFTNQTEPIHYRKRGRPDRSGY